MASSSTTLVLLRFVTCVAAAGLLAARAAPASALEPSRERVVELVTESVEHYQAGRFPEAIALLEEAYAIEPDATILYNLGRAHEGLGDLEGALDSYQAYLDAAPNAPDRGAIERRVRTLKQQIEEREALARERARADRESRGEIAAPNEPTPTPRHPSAVPWIVAGVGAAVVVTGAAFGVAASARHDDAIDAEGAREAEERSDEASGFAGVANGLFVAGGILAAAGVTWGIVDLSLSSGDVASATTVQIGPPLVLTGTF